MIGNFMPGGLKEFELFKQTIIESIPKPTFLEKGISEALKEMQFGLIAVDISG